MNLGANQGVVVMQVEAGSPAGQSGIKEGDVITELDSQKIDADHSLQTILFTHKVGETVTLTVVRDSKRIQIKLTLALRPTSQLPKDSSGG